MSDRTWTVYLAGEIHSGWRKEIEEGCRQADLPVDLTSPVIDHRNSDECGVAILGAEEKPIWRDRKGAGINAIRTRTHLEEADVVVVRFAGQYREWNAAFEAGQAAALGKPLVILHPPEHAHALKEIAAAANAVVERPDQVVSILRYVITSELG